MTGTGRTKKGAVVGTLGFLCTLGGVALCMWALLIPDWVMTSWTEGIVIVKAKFGLWQDELCDYKECVRHWRTSSDYDEHRKTTFESREETRDILTAGVIIAIASLTTLVPLLLSQPGSRARNVTRGFYLSSCLTAVFLCVSAVVMVFTSSLDTQWAPFVVIAGSSLLFVAAILMGLHCLCERTTPHNTDFNTLDVSKNNKYVKF